MKEVLFFWLLSVFCIGILLLVLGTRNVAVISKVAAVEDNGQATSLQLKTEPRTKQSTYTYDNL